ncbi:hypothetical protein DFH11DRAFT_1588100 [Phellopilus nigrolimitatus]|nr:hypothetical protein DFH11DRAFT_1588100 [Phellopilus nigrolimitatus]
MLLVLLERIFILLAFWFGAASGEKIGIITDTIFVVCVVVVSFFVFVAFLISGDIPTRFFVFLEPGAGKDTRGSQYRMEACQKSRRTQAPLSFF